MLLLLLLPLLLLLLLLLLLKLRLRLGDPQASTGAAAKAGDNARKHTITPKRPRGLRWHRWACPGQSLAQGPGPTAMRLFGLRLLPLLPLLGLMCGWWCYHRRCRHELRQELVAAEFIKQTPPGSQLI